MISNCDYLVIRKRHNLLRVLPPAGPGKTVEQGAASPNGASIRSKLILLLPRLRRFAAVLAGEPDRRDAVLRVGCRDMLEKPFQYQTGTPFDRWAFAQIYAAWLKGLRGDDEPVLESKADVDLFLPQTPHLQRDIQFPAFFATLPPQQRSVMLLVYGERFSYADAAIVLEASRDTVAERACRTLAAYAEHLNLLASAPRTEAMVEALPMSVEVSDD